MNSNEKIFVLLDEIQEKFREIANLSSNLCVVLNAEALNTLTLSLQEQIREEQ